VLEGMQGSLGGARVVKLAGWVVVVLCLVLAIWKCGVKGPPRPPEFDNQLKKVPAEAPSSDAGTQVDGEA